MHASIGDFITDLVQNSIEADASKIVLNIDEGSNVLRFTIEDNGKGMSPEVLRKVSDPFYTEAGKHSRRKVGLGIPFLLQALEAVGGKHSLESTPGRGTTIDCTFLTDHVDAPPLGDIAGTLVTLLAFPGTFELEIERKRNFAEKAGSYRLSRNELTEVLGSLQTSASLSLLRRFVQSQEDAVRE